MGPPPPTTRSSSDSKCQCEICQIARLKNKAYEAHASVHSNPKGAPKVKPTPYSPPARSLAVCSKCFCVKGRGINHVCSKVQKQSNLSELTRSSSEKTRSKVTAILIKDMCTDSGVSLRGGNIGLKTEGTSLPVQIGRPRATPKQARFSHENLKRLQVANDFSDKAVK